MISFIQGKLVAALPTQVTVDVHGIGYEALIPLSSYDKLPQPGNLVEQGVRVITDHAQLELDLEVVLKSHPTPFGWRAGRPAVARSSRPG